MSTITEETAHNLNEELIQAVYKIASSNNFNIPKTVLKAKSSLPNINADTIAIAIDTVIGRKKFKDTLSWASKGLFTHISLQQATHPQISIYHAKQYESCKHILEVGTGLGFDLSYLASAGENVTSLEPNKLTAQLARHNLNIQGISNAAILSKSFEQLLSESDIRQYDGIWADPSRRDLQSRKVDPNDYMPPLHILFELNFDGIIGIKISPSLNLTTLPPEWNRSWIGHNGECKEQVLWKNSINLKKYFIDGSTYIVDKDYSWIPSGNEETATLVSLENNNMEGKYIVEPHNALIRSGRLGLFFKENHFSVFDPKIAYAISNSRPQHSPAYSAFKILEFMPYRVKNVKDRLSSYGWKELEIKKRGMNETAEEIRKKLNFKPGKEGKGTLVVSRIEEKLIAFICKREEHA